MTATKEAHSAESLFTKTADADSSEKKEYYYRIRFREQSQEYTAQSTVSDLRGGDVVMLETEHCPEPGTVLCRTAGATEPDVKRGFSYTILRRANEEEKKKYEYLPDLEKEAASFCQQCIEKHSLSMHLVRAERFF